MNNVLDDINAMWTVSNNTSDVYTIVTTNNINQTNTNQTYTFPGTWTGAPYVYDTIQIGNIQPDDSLKVTGDAIFEGDVKIKGKSIKETLDRIEEKLAILNPNIELEEKWKELRDLRKKYMELESEIKEKEKVWKILKD